MVDPLRRIVLSNSALPHHRNAIGDGHGLGLVVGDVYYGYALAAHEIHHLDPHIFAQGGVEIAQRFVEQHQRRPCSKAAGDGDALLLPAGEFARTTIGIGTEPCHTKGMGNACRDLRGWQTLRLEPEVEIAQDRHVRPQGVILEDHADAALFGGNRSGSAPDSATVDVDSSGIRIVQPRDDA